MPVAALDIGSNSIKLLVATLDDQGQPRARFDSAIITRLSEGLGKTGLLSETAIRRTIDAIRDLLRQAGIRRGNTVRAIVTAAGRAARNTPDFLRQLESETGVRADVISGDTEAELSRLATQSAFPELDRFLMADLGGASTEIVLSRGEGSPALVSLDVGVVRLTEAHLAERDPVSRADVEHARAAAREAIEAAAPAFQDPEPPLVLVSGTATSLASLHHDLPAYDSEAVHRRIITSDDVAALTERLAAMTVAQRRALPSIDPARAEVILAGAVIVDVLFEVLERSRAWVSDRGPRWGLVWGALPAAGSSPATP